MPDLVMGISADVSDELVPESYSVLNLHSRIENTSRGTLNIVFL